MLEEFPLRASNISKRLCQCLCYTKNTVLNAAPIVCRLHLIDFEQLKIENQTVNEKIEERNEELLKLRKKNTTTVQVGYPDIT